MSKLSKKQIEEFFNEHLPYRNQVLTIHRKLCTLGPYVGNQAILRACFEASLATGRTYLNVLGVKINNRGQLEANRFRSDDVSAEDLGGSLIDVNSLPSSDKDLFIGFLKMADKGAAHLTLPMNHPWQRTHEAIDRILHYLRANLYTPTGHVMDIQVP